MPKVRNPRETINRILSAAEDEFRVFGLEGARISRIAEKAGTSKQIIYTYFKRKESLYAALGNNLTNRYRKKILQDFKPSEDPVADLGTFVSIIYDVFSSHEGRLETRIIANVNDISDELKFPRGTNAVIVILRDIMNRMRSSGISRSEYNDVDLYITIIAMSTSFNSLHSVFSELRRENSLDGVESTYWRDLIVRILVDALSCS